MIEDKIIQHLGKTPEATAKQITTAIKADRTCVNDALNALRTLAFVECEKRQGSGNDLIYWLAKPAEPPPAPVKAKPKKAAEKPADFAKAPELQYLAPEDYQLPPADPELLASANRMLQDRLDNIAQALRRVGIPALEKADGSEALNGYIEVLAVAWRDANKRAMSAESQRDAWRDSIGNISGEDTPSNAAQHIADLNRELIRLRAENTALKTLNKEMPGFGAAHEQIKTTGTRQPRRPFSVTGLAGYHAGKGQVTLFLDRRLNARSITLPAEKLAQMTGMAGQI